MTRRGRAELFKIRKESDTIVYAWPQDIIDETIKAYSVSATTPTGYGALGAADRPVLRAGQRAGLHRDRSATTTATAACAVSSSSPDPLSRTSI